MRVCRITMPPIRRVTGRFVQTRDHISAGLATLGHEVFDFDMKPVRFPVSYVSYGLGMVLGFMRALRLKADVTFTDRIEPGLLAAFARRIRGIPFVFIFNDDYSLISSFEGRRLRYAMTRILERLVPRLSDFVLAANPKMMSFCLDSGVRRNRIAVMPQGVDTGMFRPSLGSKEIERELNPDGRKVVLFVGKMNRYYNLEPIVRAIPAVLKEVPDALFVFIGEGDDLERLKAIASSLEVRDGVSFAGFRSHQDIPRAMNMASVCVFPLCDDSALAVMEYMACGKPCVLPREGTRKMGLSREVLPEGAVFPVDGTSQGFARGVTTLLKDETLAGRMGRLAREAVLDYDWSRICGQVDAVVSRIVGRNAG